MVWLCACGLGVILLLYGFENSQPFTNKAMTSEDACPQQAFILI